MANLYTLEEPADQLADQLQPEVAEVFEKIREHYIQVTSDLPDDVASKVHELAELALFAALLQIDMLSE